MREDEFEQMTPGEHLAAAQECLKNIEAGVRDLQELLDNFKPAI